MPIAVSIKAKGLSPKISKRQAQKLMASGMYALAKGWHRRYRPFKFTTPAARKYNYAKRKTKNIRTGTVRRFSNGKAMSPSGRPLYWTGTTANLAKPEDLIADSKKSAARYKRVRALNFRPGGINMRAEFTKVLESEDKALAKEAERKLRRQFSKGKRNITVK